MIAGGGGAGAPDFSRPQAGSRGKTPGGARIKRHQRGERPRDHVRTRRGENLRQAAGTEAREPRHGSEADQEVATVSAGAGAVSGGGDANGGAGGDPPPGGHAGAGAGGEAPGSGDAGAGTDSEAARDKEDKAGDGGTPLPTAAPRRASGGGDEEVSGVVIGPPGHRNGRLAFGAPGLHTAAGGGGEEPWVPLAIAAAALALLALGARRELHRGRPGYRIGERRSTAAGGTAA